MEMEEEKYTAKHPLVAFGLRRGNTFFSPEEQGGDDSPTNEESQGVKDPEPKGDDKDRPMPQRWEDLTPYEQRLVSMGIQATEAKYAEREKAAREKEAAEEETKRGSADEDTFRAELRRVIDETRKLHGKQISPKKVDELINHINNDLISRKEIEELIHHTLVAAVGMSQAQVNKAVAKATAALTKHAVDQGAAEFFAEFPHLKPVEKEVRKLVEGGIPKESIADLMGILEKLAPKPSDNDDDDDFDIEDPGSHRARAKQYGFNEIPNSRRGGATSDKSTTAKLVESTKQAIKTGNEAAVTQNVWRYLRQMNRR